MRSNLNKLPLAHIAAAFVGLFVVSSPLHALPIDWNGQLGFDTNLLQHVQRTSDNCPVGDGYCVDDVEGDARFQSFVFKLKPTLVVNDSATIKGELSTGSIRGDFLGADTEGGSSYYAQSPSDDQGITVNQLYAELYADTALFKVGKYSKNFGLGAIVNDGDDAWDRYFSVYNGIEATFNLGKFSIVPFYAKIKSGAPHNGASDASETGIIASYEDPNKNFEFSVYYGKRKVAKKSKLYNDDQIASSEVTLIDVYFSKAWDKFELAMEIPMLSGSAGTIYTDDKADLDATAYILESSYKLGEKWSMGLHGGFVQGEDGKDDFNGLYLHPNYKISELMFGYNYAAFQKDGDIFNASVTNATFAKLFARYESEDWAWNMAVIMAKANETASNGEKFYNQESRKLSQNAATADQSDDLGLEANISFDYRWNPTILVSGYFAYWQVGDYFGFTGDDTVGTDNMTASGLRLSIDF